MSEPAGGSYQLHIFVAASIRIRVGALGIRLFPRGHYLYTGSAMRNLHPRVARHGRRKKKKRWHIDYLLAAKGVRIVRIVLHPSAAREECIRNRRASQLPGASIPVPGFGSSDCRASCGSHLIHFIEMPQLLRQQ